MQNPQNFFAIFREVGIIHQLTTALLQRVLPDGLHPSHFATLSHLSNVGNGSTPVRIAHAMQVPKNSMTNTLQVLDAKGFIRFAPHPEDKRSKVVYITEAGSAFFGEAQAKLQQTYGPLMAGLTDLDREGLLTELTKLRRYLDDNRPK